jgi:hypothetical protein
MTTRYIYIISHNNKYLTNRTNVARLWDVVLEIFKSYDNPMGLWISYQKNVEDEHFTTVSARRQKIKQICIDAIGHSIRIHPNEHDMKTDRLTVYRDAIGGQ